jgi:hypothetical protein
VLFVCDIFKLYRKVLSPGALCLICCTHPFFQDLYQVQNDQVKVQEGNELHSKYSHAFFSGILFWVIREKLGELSVFVLRHYDNKKLLKTLYVQ